MDQDSSVSVDTFQGSYISNWWAHRCPYKLNIELTHSTLRACISIPPSSGFMSIVLLESVKSLIRVPLLILPLSMIRLSSSIWNNLRAARSSRRSNSRDPWESSSDYQISRFDQTWPPIRSEAMLVQAGCWSS
jgi:hypothetical protein